MLAQNKKFEILLSLAALTCCLATLAIMPYILSRPFAWMILLLACIQFIWAANSKISLLQNTLIISASCCFALFAGEIFFRFYSPNTSINSVRLYNEQAKNPSVRDPLLGFAYEAKEQSIQTKKISGNTIVYDVTVTINDKGYRITPTHPEAKNAVVFLGCSFTEGVGVNDTETYAYKTAELLGKEYQVYNFGIGGYGSHQALALLESSRLDYLKEKYENIHVYFLSYEGHPWRSAGLVEWDNYGPRYILQNGQAIRDGNFHSKLPLLTKLWESVKKSDFMQRFFIKKILWKYDDVWNLQTAILQKMRDTAQEKFHATFTLLLSPELSDKENYYKDKGFQIVNLYNALPEWPNNNTQIPLDGHPSAMAHERIAQSIAKTLLP